MTHNFNLSQFTDTLRSRIVSYVPQIINFGAFIEQEALVGITEAFPNRAQLTVKSYVAKFRLQVTSLEAYKKWGFEQKPNNEMIYDEYGKPQNSMVMIEEPSSLSILSTPYGYPFARLYLPETLNRVKRQSHAPKSQNSLC
jgi:hypothetical protein